MGLLGQQHPGKTVNGMYTGARRADSGEVRDGNGPGDRALELFEQVGCSSGRQVGPHALLHRELLWPEVPLPV